jgi:hypothetical protein
MALASGTRLGPYEIVALLGAGGMGEVYRARDPRLRREVALKVLHPGTTSAEANGAVFVAMELVDGAPLTRRVVRGGLPLGEATLVRHLHNVRVAGGGGASVISTGAGNAIGRLQIIFDFPDQAVNVWSMRLGLLTPPNAPASTP